MLILVLVSSIFTSLHNGTRNFDECSASSFAQGSCWESKQIHKAGSWACKLQGKKFVGKEAGNNNGCK